MEVEKNYSFQVDAQLIKDTLECYDNYLIEYNKDVPKEQCVIYFCSNDLYYPNNEQSFKEQVLKKNKFEWYGTRIEGAYKHIFIRDIQKQWYLGGISKEINSPNKLLELLKHETSGYDVVTLGSSSGGFAAIIYGQLLKANKSLSFNGQFEIRSLLNTSTEKTDPLIFRNRNIKDLEVWYDTRDFIVNPQSIYYFQSIKSVWDNEQYEHVKHINLNKIQFYTSNHGIPFLKTNLPSVINLSDQKLNDLSSIGVINPLFFSLKMVGLYKTILALNTIIQFGLKKIYINTVLKFIK